MCSGWKGFFRCVIWVLDFIQGKVIKLDFDGILNVISDLNRNPIFINSKEELIEKNILASADLLKEQISQYKITNRLLRDLEN